MSFSLIGGCQWLMMILGRKCTSSFVPPSYSRSSPSAGSISFNCLIYRADRRAATC